jgi:hypothetical protein
MKQDAWWWNGNGLSNKAIKRQIIKEMLWNHWKDRILNRQLKSSI